MSDVVALGELLIDFACQSTDAAGYPTLAANPGGAPANYLAALQQYGCTTALMAKVGEDAFGHLLIGTLKQCGIDTQGVRRDSSVFTTLAFVTLDAAGNRSFSSARKPGADTCLREDELLPLLPLIDDCRVFHFGTLSLTDEPVRSATKLAVVYAKRQGKLISLDPNFRKPLWTSDEAAREQMEWSLHQADIVKISDEEIEFLWGLSPEAGAEKLLHEYGVSLVYATLGAKGCYAANGSASVMVKTPDGIHAVDTTGAGDIFGGSAMSRFLRMNKSPEALNADELREIVRFACCAASLSTQKMGGLSSVVPMDAVLNAMEQ